MCDTFVALGASTTDGSAILGKNSDREANEMQSLEYYPGAVYKPGSKVRCTYIEIEQAEKSNAVIISRPFWMWGAEMGVNEHGVAIGNEAIWTRMPLHKKNDRLTGMDMLRLALERADSAKSALAVICDLLEEYGQGGAGGYEDKNMAYHNSFLIADKSEAWVLETADYLWVAKKIKGYYAISNTATIGEDFDLHHPELMDYAIKKGWHRKGTTFHFAKSYSDSLYTFFSGSKIRQEQSVCQLRDFNTKIDTAKAIKILQSHHAENYSPNSHFRGKSICAHAGNGITRNATQTVSSMVAHLSDNPVYWFTATSSACTSIFKPVWFGPKPLPELGKASGKFDSQNYWWFNELFHRSIIKDYRNRMKEVNEALKDLQSTILEEVQSFDGISGNEHTEKVFEMTKSHVSKWIDKISALPVMNKPNAYYRNYWKRLNRRAEIDI
jgi:secernin